MKSVHIQRYGGSPRIQSKCGKIQTRKTPNTDTFDAVYIFEKNEAIVLSLGNCKLPTVNKFHITHNITQKVIKPVFYHAENLIKVKLTLKNVSKMVLS